MDLPEFCRALEIYLCKKNDGHLIRITGPSFDVVSRWAEQGVPLKVAMGGIDRYFERYYRKGPRRRPVRIDFCEADVLDVFDEWRRATGLSPTSAGESSGTAGAEDAPTQKRRGPSLPEHLQRVLLRLSDLRAAGVLNESADPLIDRVSAELDVTRRRTSGVRGDERRAVVARLDELDRDLVTVARASAPAEAWNAAQLEATEELAPFCATMNADAFARALERATAQAFRARLGLPVVAFA